MIKVYHYYTPFRDYVRSFCGLVFVPPEMHEEALTHLRQVKFPESKFHDDCVWFQPIILDYFDRVWEHGNFPPAMWTHANQVTNLTNNDNEAYNSYLSKIISIPHPNVPKLTFALAKETMKAEDKMDKILSGVRTSKRDNPAYLRVQIQRETLQKNFQKGRIPLPDFMTQKKGQGDVCDS